MFCDKVTEVHDFSEYNIDMVLYIKLRNKQIKFPLIEDIRMDVANKYGMMQPGQSNTQAVRAIFIIDPNAKIRAILYYPLSTGRNFDEIKRIILVLQKADKDEGNKHLSWWLFFYKR